MRRTVLVLLIGVAVIGATLGCKRSSGSAAAAAHPSDAVQQKLQELAGKGATDCGRPTQQAQEQVKPATDCAMQAAQGKRAFYVAYDLPGLTIGVAGNTEGKLFSIESQQSAQAGGAAEVKSGPCPAELRVAQSGRVTCMTPGAGMGMTGGNPHGGMAMPSPSSPNGSGGVAMPSHPTTKPPAKPQ